MIDSNDMDITAVIVHYKYCDGNDLDTAYGFEIFDTLADAKAFRQQMAQQKRWKGGAVSSTRLLNFGADDRELALMGKILVSAAMRMREIETVSRVRSCGLSKEEKAIQ